MTTKGAPRAVVVELLHYCSRIYSKEVIISEMTEATKFPPHETPASPLPKAPNHTSARKAEANRRNAQKSTGPRTARGKSWSRLNALKHGILASQGVLSAIEGREARAAFAQTVDGLAADFAPVGTFEQLLVQKIATCFWRFRRLLRFENRASLQSFDNRTYDQMNHRERWRSTIYVEQDGGRDEEKVQLDATDVLEQAGLGMDLPSEHDTLRLVRYEASIERTLSKALAQLRAHQKARRESTKASASYRAPAYADRAVIVDRKASERNRASGVTPLGAKAGLAAHRKTERTIEAEMAMLQEEDSADDAEKNQTKPNILEDTEAMARHQRMIESADRILKLSASLEPRRREPGK
jgi:hypothetical protein